MHEADGSAVGRELASLHNLEEDEVFGFRFAEKLFVHVEMVGAAVIDQLSEMYDNAVEVPQRVPHIDIDIGVANRVIELRNG
jgi:hypothetical protein